LYVTNILLLSLTGIGNSFQRKWGWYKIWNFTF